MTAPAHKTETPPWPAGATAGPALFRARALKQAGCPGVHEPLAGCNAGRGTGARLSEAILQAAWRRAGERRLAVRARDGHFYRVLYPGRPGPGRGPDFLDAILESEDGLRLYGDVEVHVRPSGWREHGHGGDRRYNGVVFHVALGLGEDAASASGRSIPLLVLGQAQAGVRRPEPDADGPEGQESEATGGGANLAPALAANYAPAAPPIPFFDLGAAGDQRFTAKSSGFVLEIKRSGADQALYSAVMEGMGYPRNRSQFRRLAERMPWAALAAGLAHGAAAAGALEHRLLWAAGWGPKPPATGALDGRAPGWDLPGGRPDNHPKRRIGGMAAIAARWLHAGGPSSALAHVLLGGSGHEDVVQCLCAGGQGGSGRALVGEGRAMEIVVNAVLPCMHAWATLSGDGPLAARCAGLFRTFPKLPENAVSREARTLLAAHGLRPEVKGAREQQGLHLLYRAMSAPVVLPRQLPLL